MTPGTRRYKRITNKRTLESIARRYERGEALNVIAAEHGIYPTTVRHIAVAEGMNVRRVGRPGGVRK